MKTISLFGTGWLGMPLAKQLVSQGYQVKGSTTRAKRMDELEQAGITPYVFKLDDIARQIQQTGEIPTALVSFLSAEILIINIPGKDIEAFAQLAKAVAGSSIKKLIFVSSSSVYPQVENKIYQAQSNTDPEHPLVQIEQLFRQIDSVETTIVRMAGLIGGRRHPGRFFKPGRVVKLPNAPVNLIHLDDCLGILCAIIKQNAWGEIFNGVADSHPIKKTFYTHAAALAGLPTPQFDDDEQSGKIVDGRKTSSRLSYKFTHPDLIKIVFD